MTSPYASATAVVDTMPTPSIDTKSMSHLTAVVGDAEGDNHQTGSETNAQREIDAHIENPDAPDKGNGDVSFPTEIDNQITEGRKVSTPPKIAVDGGDTTLISASEEQPENTQVQDTQGTKEQEVQENNTYSGEPQAALENGVAPGSSTEDINVPQTPQANEALMTSVRSLGLYDQPGSAIATGLQPMIHAEQESLDFYGDAIYDAQTLMNLQMMNAFGPPLIDPSPIADVEGTRIQAYAKLEFDDGEFYMNTHSVYLGRDLQAARTAIRREKEIERMKIEEEAMNIKSDTPKRVKKEESRYSKSIASEAGGILREQDDSDSEKAFKKKKSRKTSKMSKSTGSSSLSRRNSVAQLGETVTYEAQQAPRFAGAETAGAASLDLAALIPDPDECPLIGIHPPKSHPAVAYKSISRRHVQIAFNKDKNLFEALIMGRNGAFIDGDFCPYRDVKELKSGSTLQIGAVEVKFVLPNVIAGETGAEQHADYEDNVVVDRYSEGGKEMSFDFEDRPRAGANLEDTSEEDSSENEDENRNQDQEDDGEELEDDGEELEDDDADEEEDGDERSIINGYSSGADGEDLDEPVETIEPHNNLSDSVQKRDKKRGPGRPPKDGIMSKREKQLAKRAALELQKNHKAKKSVPQPVTSTSTSTSTTGKNKVGRPRKHPRPETPPIKKEKRKYTKRKPKEPKDPNAKEGSGEDQPAKEKKDKKPPKPPRSPSPEVKEEDFTPEQLAKPPANYVTLIHEALSNSKSGPLSLPDIYRAIQRKWPYFRFRCQTNGWQSSVRHNLSQHHAFTKVGKEGKGYSWTVVDGVSIEKEKKRRVTPPPGQPHMHPQQIYQAGHPPHMYPGHHYGPGMMGPPPPGYQISYQMPPNGQQMHPHYMGHHPHGPPPPHGYPHLNAPMPPPYPLPAQLAPPSQGSYSSPYAPKPQGPPPPMAQSNAQYSSGLQHSAPNSAVTTEPQPPEVPAQISALTPVTVPLQTPAQAQVQSPPTPAPATSSPQAPAVRPDEKVRQFIESFKPTLLKLLTEWKSERPGAVVDSVVNRILGVTTVSVVENDPHEKMLIEILSKQLSKQYGDDFNKPAPSPVTSQQTDEQQPQSQTPANQSGTQGNATPQPGKSTGSERSTPTVMRPSFTGRPPSIPRPPMKTPGTHRTNSESPASAPPRQSVAPSSASPVATPSAAPSPAAGSPSAPATHGASTPKLTQNGADQSAGARWQSEEAEISKRLNGNGQLAGLKRPLDDMDDIDENRDFKRHTTSAPPQLKT
jgi:hypothetical protein